MASGNSKAARKRTRVLVDLDDQPTLLRALAGVHHRGMRLKELALLGLAAERLGLTAEVQDNGLRLAGLEVLPRLPPAEAEPLELDVRDVESPLGDLSAVRDVADAFF